MLCKETKQTVIFFFWIFHSFIWERESMNKRREKGRGRGRGRGTHRLPTELGGVGSGGRRWRVGEWLGGWLNPMTWAKVRHLSNSATQVSPGMIFRKVFTISHWNKMGLSAWYSINICWMREWMKIHKFPFLRAHHTLWIQINVGMWLDLLPSFFQAFFNWTIYWTTPWTRQVCKLLTV